ncbi:MAG: DUF1566 domain-containing protein [Bacteroidaceae bacterium]|nr:DUF1566 domain-containing protein [Bacteroidaceae bacterium]
MRTFRQFLLLLAATVLTTTVQAQVISGDLNHNGELDVGDITLLINDYLTGEEVLITVQDLNLNNGHEAVDLGLSVKWATMNIGANVPEDFGGYFAWGETTAKNTYNWSTYKWYDSSNHVFTKYNDSSYTSYGRVDHKTTLDTCDDAACVNWGGTWRMPTYDELYELGTKCTCLWTTQNGVNGWKMTGPNGNSIFLPAAGGYRTDGSNNYEGGSYGYYWSSSLYKYNPNHAQYLYFDTNRVNWFSNGRCFGHSVRAVCP